MFKSSTHSEETRAFLQHRVARFGLFAGSISLSFWLWRLANIVSNPNFWNGSMTAHLVSATSFLSIGLALRWGRPTALAIRWVEALGLWIGGIAIIAMEPFIPIAARPELIVLLALMLGHVARAAYVPSSFWRTGMLSGVLVIPIYIFTRHRYLQAPGAFWDLLKPFTIGKTAEQGAQAAAIGAVVWWSFITITLMSTSRVIYGLRKQVEGFSQLGQYRLGQKLGEGGMGVVFRAQHGMLRRPTAVKLLPPEKAGRRALERFEREVRLTARLTHPNTVTIFDYGRSPDGVFYYAMELLRGATLEQIVQLDGPQPIGRVVHLLSQAAGALSEAHGVGLIHRDIKPANIMVTRQGGALDVAKVLDFGLVKEVGAGEVTTSEAGTSQEGTIAGTPLYLAPESIRSPAEVGPEGDIYALGAVGYYLVTGEHVFPGQSVVDICSKHLHVEPTPPSERSGRSLPASLEALILDCLKKDPAGRPASAEVFRQRLLTLRGEHPWLESDASAWWARCGDVLHRAPSSERKVDTQAQTLAVDLGGRDVHTPMSTG